MPRISRTRMRIPTRPIPHPIPSIMFIMTTMRDRLTHQRLVPSS